SPQGVMTFATVLLGCTALPLFWGLKDASLAYVTGVRMWVVILGLIYLCPLNVWLLNQFPSNTSAKYLLVGIGGSLGGATLGRMTAAACMLLWHTTGHWGAPAYYIVMV